MSPPAGNPRFASVEPSLIREVNSRKKPGDIDLGLGEPVLPPDLGPLQRALRWVEENGCPYTANAGEMDLRQAVGRYVGTDPSRVVITNGSQEAVYLAIRVAIDPSHDEVLIVDPSYPAYAKICEVEGIAFRTASLSSDDGFAPRARPVLDALGERTRLVIISSPCNPTARVWPRSELEVLAASLPAGCRVLSDEVYRELHFGDAPTSISSLSPHTLVAGGISKSHALTGLRLGWLACPSDLVGSAIRAHQLMTTAASTFSQRVAIEVLGSGDVSHRAAYRERRAALLSALERSGLEYVPPDGAFYCLVRLPAGVGPSRDASLRLIEEKRVVTVPGIAFGAACEGWLRISWASEPALVASGIQRIAEWFHAYE